MRDIRFRAWDKHLKRIIPWEQMRVMGLNAYFGAVFELMQYTGLKDKNGLEIYEGDIVLLSRSPEIPREVYWEEDGCQYRLASRGDRQFDKTSILAFAKTGEGIGNIYENPELLKEKQP